MLFSLGGRFTRQFYAASRYNETSLVDETQLKNRRCLVTEFHFAEDVYRNMSCALSGDLLCASRSVRFYPELPEPRLWPA